MFAYLKGAGASAFVATLLTPLFFYFGSEALGTSLHELFMALTLTIASSYVGCIFGWIVLVLLLKDTPIDTGAAIMLYVLLGGMFTALLSLIFTAYVFIFILVTVSGSVSFYLAQRVKNRLLSWSAVLFGILALLTSSYSYLYLTIGG